MMTSENIRNFCIIAHIDHGKSTLADRFLEITGTLPRVDTPQMLDSMELERKRGITIKNHSVRMHYELNGQTYCLNLIDTPGHADFSYEVARAIASCEGAILLVDATQGIQAQTVAHLRVAKQHNLVIIPALNKMDIAPDNVDILWEEVSTLAEVPPENVHFISARTGEGVETLLRDVIERIPPPPVREDPLQVLIYDSYYDTYRGVVCYVRVFSGTLKKNSTLQIMSSGYTFQPEEIGYLTLRRTPADCLQCGDVGYIVTGIKSAGIVHPGDTLTEKDNPASSPYYQMRRPLPMVFASLFPSSGEDFEEVKKAIERLHLNDPAFTFQQERSRALGPGFRCGFLGTLHLEVVQERLEKEYGVDVFLTTPSVPYQVVLRNGETITIHNPAHLPPLSQVKEIREPYMRVEIITPLQYFADIIELCKKYRGEYISQNVISQEHVELLFDMPFAEIIYDFYDNLKSISRGFASMNYEFTGWRANDLVRVDILVHGEPVDGLSFIVHRDRAYHYGKEMCRKLKEHIPRQLFEVAIQAAIGSKVIARETIPAIRKNVTAKCYGGDVTRKRKLLERQKEGKKRLKQIGRVEVPQSAFFAVLKISR